MAARRAPVLVTGLPRSGTTWLARLLATSPGTALAGREPMNPRERQYALGGTLTGWTRLSEPSARQRRALRATYQGLNPRVYGKYGRHQWRAPLPWTRVVVKDPFAMLSVPAVSAVTGARAVQLYRHPAAVLASYRRMGWRPDLAEIAPFAGEAAAGEVAERLWSRGADSLDDTEQMGVFWSVLTTLALDDLEATPGAVLVAHQELASGGLRAADVLFTTLGLTTGPETTAELTPPRLTGQTSTRQTSTGQTSTGQTSTGQTSEVAPGTARPTLHRFERDPAEVASSWRRHVPDHDVHRIEEITAPVRARAESLRLDLGT